MDEITSANAEAETNSAEQSNLSVKQLANRRLGQLTQSTPAPEEEAKENSEEVVEEQTEVQEVEETQEQPESSETKSEENVLSQLDFDNLSEQDIVTLIEEKKQKEKEKLIHNWENEGITVEKGRWGKVFVISGKKRKQLDAKKDPKALTLEEAKTILKS